MTDETRYQKLQRETKEELARERGIIKGMSPEQKQVVAVIAMVVAVVVIAITLLFSGIARGATFEMDIDCEGEVCTVAKKDIKALIKHNNAVTRELDKQMARKCNSLSEI